jgi:hypothetical protein
MGRAIHQYHHQCSTTRGGGGRDGTAPGRRAAFLFFYLKDECGEELMFLLVGDFKLHALNY